MDPLMTVVADAVELLAARQAEALVELLRHSLGADAPALAALEEVGTAPDDPAARWRLRQALFDAAVSNGAFAVEIARLVAEARKNQDESTSDGAVAAAAVRVGPAGPVRGFPGLTVAATSPQTTAGTDFSIFVLLQNPFDVPITVHQVQTHIPVELIDVNWWRLEQAKLSTPPDESGEPAAPTMSPYQRLRRQRQLRREHRGVATAIGTEVTPQEAGEMFSGKAHIDGSINLTGEAKASVGVNFVMPDNATSDSLDAVVRRIIDYRRGIIPVRLQPGDSVVRQFVLRTRSRLFFRPLSHTFQIQVNYSVDGVDHTGTIPYQLSIQAALGSIAWGSVAGAALGTLVKSLAATTPTMQALAALQALAVSMMASVAVVVAFARKSSAQPLVSVEDFWGGLVIGFTVGYFGFQTFFHLFPAGG